MAKPYQFDKQLWLRFIRTAQPYFFPIAPRQTGVFLGLILVLLLVIIALTFFLTVGLTFLVPTILPDFISQAASGLIENVNSLLKSPVPYVAFGTLFLSSLFFVSQKPKLLEL